LRVLQLVAIKGRGGTGASVVTLSKALASSGFKVWIVCRGSSNVFRSLKGCKDITIISDISLPRKFNLKGIFRFLKCVVRITALIKRNNINVVHSHSSPDGRVGWIMKLLFPYVIFVRTRHIPLPINDKVQCALSDSVVSVSYCVREHVGFGCLEKGPVIYDAFNPGSCIDACSRKHFVIRNISRYQQVKGLEFFVEAVEHLNRLINLKAEVVGRKNTHSNPYYLKIERMVNRRGLGDTLSLRGYTDDIDYLYSASVVVLTSVDSEGSSRVAIESLNYGVPLVYHRVGAIGEIAEDGKTGLGVDAGDVDGLVSALLTLWRHPKLIAKMGCNGKRRSFRFRQERLLEDYRRVYGL